MIACIYRLKIVFLTKELCNTNGPLIGTKKVKVMTPNGLVTTKSVND